MSNKLTKYPVKKHIILEEFKDSPYIDIIELSPQNLQKYVNSIAEYYQTSDIGNKLIETYISMVNANTTTNQHDN